MNFDFVAKVEENDIYFKFSDLVEDYAPNHAHVFYSLELDLVDSGVRSYEIRINKISFSYRVKYSESWSHKEKIIDLEDPKEWVVWEDVEFIDKELSIDSMSIDYTQKQITIE